ncbi:MAG: hypothetical protein P8H91_01050 [Flavobacteriaceae bacterium]|nr:hypothetical protein [Flavobacteriaceae bacterium]
MKFEKQIVAFNEREYNRAIQDANNKIKRLKDALKWCSSFVMTSNIDKEKFADDCVAEFTRVFTKKWAVKYPDIKANKLLMLLDVPMAELRALETLIMAIQQPVKVVGGKFEADVSKEAFTRYTKNEKENKMLSLVERLNNVVDEVQREQQVFKLTLAQAMPSLLQFDMVQNKLSMKIS